MIHGVFYDHLPQGAIRVREAVFMKEQGFENEFDKTDLYAVHYVLFDRDIPIACCRYFPDTTPDDYLIGRVAVLPEYRNLHLGARLMADAEAHIRTKGGKKLSLSAQLRVKGFYEKQGYIPMGEVYMDEHCAHIHMEKQL